MRSIDIFIPKSYSYAIRSYLPEIRSYFGGYISGIIRTHNSQMQDDILDIPPIYIIYGNINGNAY